MPQHLSEQRQTGLPRRSQLVQRVETLFRLLVERPQSDRSGPRLDIAGSISINGKIHRDGVTVIQVERPDVQGSTGEIDPARSFGDNSHWKALLYPVEHPERTRTPGVSRPVLRPCMQA